METMKKPIFTVKNIVLVLTNLLLILNFCSIAKANSDLPMAMFAFLGGPLAESIKRTFGSSFFYVSIIVIIPIIILNAIYVEKINEKIKGCIITVAAALDLILYIVFYAGIKSLSKGYADFSAAFVFIIIVNVLILVPSILVAIQKLDTNTDIIAFFAEIQKKNAMRQPMAGGFCIKCGGPLAVGFAVCPRCGNPVAPAAPQQMMQQPMQQMPPQAPNYGVGAPQQAPTYGVGAPVQQVPQQVQQTMPQNNNPQI